MNRILMKNFTTKSYSDGEEELGATKSNPFSLRKFALEMGARNGLVFFFV